jgi:Uma2 family endonuclease
MVSGTIRHGQIVGNTSSSLHAQLRQRDSYEFATALRIHAPTTGLYTYPDIVVVCGEPQLEDAHQDTLLNPTALIEVLSPSTESHDRGKKFQHYRSIASLQEYVLIEQENPRIERYLRQANDQWLLSDAVGMDTALTLPSIGCELRLQDVYEKVTFGD